MISSSILSHRCPTTATDRVNIVTIPAAERTLPFSLPFLPEVGAAPSSVESYSTPHSSQPQHAKSSEESIITERK